MRERKEKKKDDLDTTTTIVDMNVEGFRWYNPNRKKDGGEKPALTKSERRAIVKGAFLAMLPMLFCIILAMLAVFGLAFLWLK